jgi:hypothetical protein
MRGSPSFGVIENGRPINRRWPQSIGSYSSPGRIEREEGSARQKESIVLDEKFVGGAAGSRSGFIKKYVAHESSRILRMS